MVLDRHGLGCNNQNMIKRAEFLVRGDVILPTSATPFGGTVIRSEYLPEQADPYIEASFSNSGPDAEERQPSSRVTFMWETTGPGYAAPEPGTVRTYVVPDGYHFTVA